MTPAERAAVHALAGAFSRLSLAAELAVLDAGQLPALERVRKLSLANFAAAMDALAAQPPVQRDAVSPERLENERFLARAFEQVCGINSVMRGGPAHPNDPPMSSALPSAALPPAEPPSPPPRAAQTPSTSTAPRLPADAGGGRAVPGKRTMAATALELAAQAPFTALQLARETGRDIRSCETTLASLKARGRLVMTAPPGGKRALLKGERSTYTLPGVPPAEAPRAEPAAAAPAKRRQPTASAVTTPASSVRLNPRAQGPVAGQHAKAADFYADKPRLPPARAPQVQERGARHG